MIAALRRWFASEPVTKYEREFHSPRFQAELNKLRDRNDAYKEAMAEIYGTSKEMDVLNIAAKALGKPRP